MVKIEMENYITTKALYWKTQGSIPQFETIRIQFDENSLMVKVKAAVFGKALYRAITIGHLKISPPRVLGSLLSGETINEIPGLSKGSRIVINPHATDPKGNKLCITPGAISQIVKIHGALDQGVFIIPSNVSYEESVYSELIACAIESLNKIENANEIVIMGCGLMAFIQVQIAKHIGYKKIICIYNHPNRIELIKRFGAIPVEYIGNKELLKQQVRSLTNGKNIAFIDSAGTIDSIQTLLDLASENAELVLFSGYPIGSTVQIDLNKIHYNNIHVMGSYHFRSEFFSNAIELLKNHSIDINSLITGEIYWKNMDSIFEKFKSDDNISNIVIFD